MGGLGSGGHGAVGAKGKLDVDETQPIEPIDPPSDLGADVLAVWQTLAPLALEARTLVPATVSRFVLLCRQMVLERQMSQKIAEDGWTYIAVTIDGSGTERQQLKAHPLCGAQRGMMQRIEVGMTAFRLAPIGKPMPTKPKEKPKSAFERLQAERSIRAVG